MKQKNNNFFLEITQRRQSNIIFGIMEGKKPQRRILQKQQKSFKSKDEIKVFSYVPKQNNSLAAHKSSKTFSEKVLSRRKTKPGRSGFITNNSVQWKGGHFFLLLSTLVLQEQVTERGKWKTFKVLISSVKRHNLT